MLRFVRRLTPKAVKRRAASVFESLARGLHQTIGRLHGEIAVNRENIRSLAITGDNLRRQLAELQVRVFELEPEIVQPPETAAAAAADLLAEYGLAGRVNLAVSKHDPMYQVMLSAGMGPQIGYLDYLRLGITVSQALHRVVRDRFGGWDRVGRVLDFASGYGRVTRFLAAEVDPARVWVSDLKARAVDFQRQQFGFNGFVSTALPEDLQVDARFDVIFVVSLFSHLPDATFGRWLRKLCELCGPGGIVAFTVHDTSLLPAGRRRPADGIHFSAVNEEVSLLVSDRPLDANSYGLTYVNEGYIRRVIHSLPLRDKRYVRLERGLANYQDIYIVSGELADQSQRTSSPVVRKAA